MTYMIYLCPKPLPFFDPQSNSKNTPQEFDRKFFSSTKYSIIMESLWEYNSGWSHCKITYIIKSKRIELDLIKYKPDMYPHRHSESLSKLFNFYFILFEYFQDIWIGSICDLDNFYIWKWRLATMFIWLLNTSQ